VGDLGVTPTADGVEVGVTLDGPSASQVYSIVLDTGGLVAALNADGASIDLIDPSATPPSGSSGPVVVGHIGAPGLTDADGQGGLSTDVAVSLVSPGAVTIPPGVDPTVVATLATHEVLVAYTINPAYLAAPARAYPVKLDPTVCIQNASGCTGTSWDTFFMQGQPNSHPFGWTVDRVGVDGQGNGYGLMRSLLYFPWITLPDGAQVTSASLILQQTANLGTTATQFRALEVRGRWDTSTSWSGNPTGTDAQPSVTTTNQSAAVSACASSCSRTLNVAAIVRDW